MLDSSKAILRLLIEVDFWGHEQFFPKNNLIFIGQFKCSLISMLIIWDWFVLILQKMAILMLNLSHDFLNIFKITIDPHMFIFVVNLSWLTKEFLYGPWACECRYNYLVIVSPPILARIIPLLWIKPSTTGTTWVNSAPISTTNEL